MFRLRDVRLLETKYFITCLFSLEAITKVFAVSWGLPAAGSIVFDAVVRSMLLYGLECIQLTQVEQNKIDALQIK